MNDLVVVIDNCSFWNCSASNGGAIAVVDTVLLINGSSFEGNRGSYSGGAMQLNCSQIGKKDCDFMISDSTMKNNKAHLKGGVISYNLK